MDCCRVAEGLRALAELLSLPSQRLQTLAELLSLPTPSGACCHVHQQRLRPATFSITERPTTRGPLRLKAGASCMAMANPTGSSVCASLKGGDSQYAWWRRCSACLSVRKCWRMRARRRVVGCSSQLTGGAECRDRKSVV